MNTVTTSLTMSEAPPDQLTLQELYDAIADYTLPPAMLGVLGERIAARWLEEHGYTVISRNWHSRFGELDLVVMNTDRRIIFVEVKTRRSTRFGIPQESVTARKQANLKRTVAYWFLEPEHRIPHTGTRFDVIAILAPIGMEPTVNHIKGAF